MRVNEVKRKLASGKPTFGTWISLGNYYATRALARSGFDWLTVDLEHSPIDWEQSSALFGAIADAGCVPIARVPSGAHWEIKRALDAGAWGIVVPMVDTAIQADKAVQAAKYPPTGTRSAGGGLHALSFDAGVLDYYEHANDEILVVLMTESPEGVRNAPDIYSLPGIDAIFIGPTDLRSNMRTHDNLHVSDTDLEALISRIVEVGQDTGLPTGIMTLDSTEAASRVEQGMQFIAVSSDLHMLTSTAIKTVGLLSGEQSSTSVAY